MPSGNSLSDTVGESANKSKKAELSQAEKDKRAAILAAEKAEVWQSISALYIPFSLFIACVIFSGGVFLVYYNEPIGWGFIATTVIIALSAFIALFRFQNKYRAQGIIGGQDTEMVGPKIVGGASESESKIEAESKPESEDSSQT